MLNNFYYITKCFQKPFKRHILTKKSKKRKRGMRKPGILGATNKDFVQRLLGLK